MASSITKKYAINAKGILHIDGEYIGFLIGIGQGICVCGQRISS